MKQEEFNILLRERVAEIERVLTVKREEYSKGGDVFSNFKRGAGMSFHNEPESYAWELMVKHLQSIKDIIAHLEVDGYNGYPTKELVREKVGDAINYLLLIELMILERIRKGNPHI